MDIFGVRVDKVTMDQALEIVIGWLKNPSSKKHYIVTPNPEFIMAAQKDKEFKEVLNNADLAIPDGVGLKLAADIVCTVSGVDLMDNLCKASADYGFTIGLLGGRDGVAVKAAECLSKKYPRLKVVLAENGPEVDINGDVGAHRAMVLRNRRGAPERKCDILFVAFGQVKQEKWIAKNLPKLPIKVAMGVGGSFDYLSGSIPRAPLFMRILGTEWLFRLMVQPWRIRRQLQLLKFLAMVLVKR